MISPEAVRAVLAREDRTDPRYWAIRWQYGRALGCDGFFDDLLRAAAHADPGNLDRIESGFPEIALAVYNWKNVSGWAQEVEAWAESLVPEVPQ